MTTCTITRRVALGLAGSAVVAAGLAMAPAAAVAEDCAKVPITFTFWGSVNEKNDIETAVRTFNESHPCIEVTAMHIPSAGTNYVQKLTTMIASNTAPDLGYLSESQAFQWAAEGKIYDLSAFMGDKPEEQYIGSTIYRVGDTLLGTGLATGVMLIYYNKDVFDAAGVPYPPAKADAAWGWDEFVKNAKLLTKDRAGHNATEAEFNPDEIDTYGITMPSWWAGWYPYVLSNGGQFASEDGTNLLLNQPKAVEALQKIQDLIYVDHVMPNPTQTSTLPAGDILMQSRKVAMSMDGMWRVTDFSKLGINWGLAVLPKFKEADTVLISAPKVIFSGTKHPKEAYEFYKYISDPAQVGLFKSGLWAPHELAYFTDPAKLATWITAPDGAYPPEAMDAVVDYTLNHTPVQSPPYWLQNAGQILSEAIDPNIQSMLNGSVTAQEAMDKAVETAKPMMKGRW